MLFEKKAVVAAIAVTLGTVGVTGAASAATTLTFIDNATETLAGATEAGNTAKFTAGSEFHVATPGGTKKNDGNKDIIAGGESWSFADGTGAMTGVSGAGLISANSGHAVGSPGAVITSGIAGFPIGSAAGTHDILGLGADFLMAGNFTMHAPTTTSAAGLAFGPAVISGITPGTAGSFTVHMPVLNVQWANGSYIIGGDDGAGTACSATTGCGGAGVTFMGTTDGVGNFTLSARATMTANEVTVGGFTGNHVEFALRGSYSTSAVPVPAAAWLFGSGLMGMVGVARRRRNKA